MAKVTIQSKFLKAYPKKQKLIDIKKSLRML